MVIPIIASNPTAGIIFGAGLTYSYKTNPSDSKLSNITGNATYSTKGLVNLNVKSNVFIVKERLVLNGDWRYLVNTETTYGLGSNNYSTLGLIDVNGYSAHTDTLGQSLEFSQIRIHETASWRLFGNFYAGIGFQFDKRYKIKDHVLENGDTARSFHYQYSKSHGFDPANYNSGGMGINFLADSRDNQVNAWRGYYVNVNYLLNTTWLGSTKNSSLLLTEYRSFHNLSKRNPSHVLAFWLYGSFRVSGEIPYLALPSIGNDQRQRSGRGYPFGTFRGENLAYAESEYRFPISPTTGILGMVIFANATTTTNNNAGIELFQYVRAAWGGGLRIMIEKTSRTRLGIDVAVANGKAGIYLGAQETF